MTKKINYQRLQLEDINKPCKELATYLLGKILVRNLDQAVLKGRIVETEAYLGGEDKASHSYNNRHSAANEPMYMPAGTCYVYMTFGMYYCLNISSKEPGAAVLIRAIEPLVGLDNMGVLRAKKMKTNKMLKPSQLCNGPSKLCMAMEIFKSNCNKLDVTDITNQDLWLEDDLEFDRTNLRIVSCPRIGLNYGDEWISAPLRFYVLNNKFISKRDKRAEKMFDIEN